MVVRFQNRRADELRPMFFGPGFVKNALGSCFVKFGDTHVICAASLDEKVPPFLRNTGSGWVTAEYGMLPCASSERIDREAMKGKQTGRTQEIQRLVGRALRAAVDLKALGERQIRIDCDVIQADGGTRTASITGGFIAMKQLILSLLRKRRLTEDPILHPVAAISCGMIKGTPLLDIDYSEDSTAEVDANVVMDDQFRIIELQMTAEHQAYGRDQLQKLLDLAEKGLREIFEKQKELNL